MSLTNYDPITDAYTLSRMCDLQKMWLQVDGNNTRIILSPIQNGRHLADDIFKSIFYGILI